MSIWASCSATWCWNKEHRFTHDWFQRPGLDQSPLSSEHTLAPKISFPREPVHWGQPPRSPCFAEKETEAQKESHFLKVTKAWVTRHRLDSRSEGTQTYPLRLGSQVPLVSPAYSFHFPSLLASIMRQIHEIGPVFLNVWHRMSSSESHRALGIHGESLLNPLCSHPHG